VQVGEFFRACEDPKVGSIPLESVDNARSTSGSAKWNKEVDIRSIMAAGAEHNSGVRKTKPVQIESREVVNQFTDKRMLSSSHHHAI
jgi:hypothetical protein